MKRIEFFYDFSCPYAYLAHTQIERIAADAQAELVWKLMLLGGVFQAIGTPNVPMMSMPSAKAKLNEVDMFRWADHWSVPLAPPPTHPNRTVLALRATLASDDLPRATKALFIAYWAKGLDVSNPDVVRETLDAAAIAPAEHTLAHESLRTS